MCVKQEEGNKPLVVGLAFPIFTAIEAGHKFNPNRMQQSPKGIWQNVICIDLIPFFQDIVKLM